MERTTSPANKLVIKRILAQDSNNVCADCKTATYPRWASWNIGILICIRCSGIHRSLGTHISKVRSIDLDTWNDQQLEKLKTVGNKASNAYWEAKLPPNYVPDESKIMNFIKTKYELRRWVGQSQSSPQVPLRVRAAAPAATGQQTTTATLPSVGQSTGVQGQEPSSNDSTRYSTPVGGSHTDLLDLGSSVQQAKQQQAERDQQRAQSSTSRVDVKNSILSLYTQPLKPSPSSSTSSLAPQQQQQAPTLRPTRPQQQTDAAMLDDEDLVNVWK